MLKGDFSEVQVHTGSRAAEAARSVEARAFTLGRDLIFGAGEYSPGTGFGDSLIAHELTHVLQQRGRSSSQAGNPSQIDVSDDSAAEAEAEANALRAPSGHEPARPRPNSPLTLQRSNIDSAPPDIPCEVESDVMPASGTDVMFSWSRSGLTLGRDAVDRFLLAWRGEDVRIDAYSSVEGLEAFNWRLSCDRAQAVKSELMAPTIMDVAAIPAAKIRTVAHGETKLFDPASLAPNRRAIISGVTVPIVPPPEPEDCRSFIGTCEYYHCRERTHRCGPTGYYQGYGFKYCDRFSNLTRPTMTTAGQDWIDLTLRCLQVRMENDIPADADCGDARSQAFNAHPPCYVESGVCSLPRETLAGSQILSLQRTCSSRRN